MGKQYEDMTEEEKANHDKWVRRGEKVTAAGNGMQKAGGAMMGCGCLMTLFITIPIIIIVIFLL